MKRYVGYIIILIICFVYWVIDSIWVYISFESNLNDLIFRNPSSFLNTFMLEVTPYQFVSRFIVISMFIILGVIIIEFIKKKYEYQKKTKESYDTFLKVLNSIDASIYVSDIESREILFMNKNLVDELGSDFSGKICYDIFKNSANRFNNFSNKELINKDENPDDPVISEFQNPITKSWYLNHDRTIKWIDGRTVHLQIATDITLLKDLQEKQKKADEYIRQSKKMESVGILAEGIAHDFNNLLFPIIGMARMLMNNLPKDSKNYKNAKIIKDAGKRGEKLIKQILYFSSGTKMKKEPIYIQNIVEEALILSESTVTSSIKINKYIQKDCGYIMADPTQIHQIIVNLIKNAIHAVDEKKGEIDIRLRELSDNVIIYPKLNKYKKYIVLSVSDNGCGMDASVIEKIFDPYFTTKEKGKGTGLGLSVVYKIVQDHNGEITVNSTIGEGSVFTIYLPLFDEKNEKQKSEFMIKDKKEKTEHILLVDDEELVALVVKAMITKMGYKVTVYTDSKKALEDFRYNPNKFDLLITDVSMPNMNGDELAQEIHLIREDIPILFCTGFNYNIDKQKAKSLGVKSVLIKPIEYDALEKLLSMMFIKVDKLQTL